VGHVAYMRDIRNSYIISDRKSRRVNERITLKWIIKKEGAK
jgi:hypothetical protein